MAAASALVPARGGPRAGPPVFGTVLLDEPDRRHPNLHRTTTVYPPSATGHPAPVQPLAAPQVDGEEPALDALEVSVPEPHVRVVQDQVGKRITTDEDRRSLEVPDYGRTRLPVVPLEPQRSTRSACLKELPEIPAHRLSPPRESTPVDPHTRF